MSRRSQILLSWVLRSGAISMLGLLLKKYADAHFRPAGHPWLIVTHSLNAVALLALSLRWSQPSLRKTAMTVALIAILASFVVAQRLPQ